MDKYSVKLYTRAYRDLDHIYSYIPENLKEPGVVGSIIDQLEMANKGQKEVHIVTVRYTRRIFEAEHNRTITQSTSAIPPY